MYIPVCRRILNSGHRNPDFNLSLFSSHFLSSLSHLSFASVFQSLFYFLLLSFSFSSFLFFIRVSFYNPTFFSISLLLRRSRARSLSPSLSPKGAKKPSVAEFSRFHPLPIQKQKKKKRESYPPVEFDSGIAQLVEAIMAEVENSILAADESFAPSEGVPDDLYQTGNVTVGTRRQANGTIGSVYSGNKIKHLKKEDGIPLWRKDIQHQFLKLVFEDRTKVFTRQSDKQKDMDFADIYMDAMARSSKTSKILKDKLQNDKPAALSMAMVCLLVNFGRMNTTLNCKSLFSFRFFFLFFFFFLSVFILLFYCWEN